ncbi:solute carrier family 43 member 3a isoform X2 [Ictalurus punctatus]|uniref:Solute carrier family 43 member 3a isoform X2 n=1 Tax=Ictalurus punctatus TaxID=7998 RepID=A0A2D0QJJ6_ICTPU|nr:solute carrier family 43 member 3a isoform X2 [Ictalurus punctatus]
MLGCDGESGTRVRHKLTLVTGLLECLCFAGVVFGWASLVFVLKTDGYFSDLCVNVTEANGTSAKVTLLDCSAQDEQFSLIFTVASFMNNFLTFPNGFLFDLYGTMATRFLAIFLYTTGTLLVAFSSKALSLLLFPALSFIAVGGILLLLTNMQVGNLCDTHRSTIITLYNGAFDSSSAIFLIIKVLYEKGISLQTSFLFLSACDIIHLLRTLFLLPKSHIPSPIPESYTYGVSCRKSRSYNVEEYESKQELQDLPDRAGQNNSRDTDQLKTDDSPQNLSKVSRYTNAFAFTQLTGILCAPWNGLLMDRHKGKALKPGETEKEADLRSTVLSLFLTSLQCLIFSVCTTIPVLPLQYVTFILQVLNRSFLYGGNAAFISIAFPAQHFGKMYGLMMSLSAVVSLLQYPCFALVKAFGGDPFYVNLILTILTLLAFVHPLNVFLHCRSMATQREMTQSTLPADSSRTGPTL